MILSTTADHLGRPVVVIDAAVFAELAAARDAAWREVPGFAVGSSAVIPANTAAGAALAELHPTVRALDAFVVAAPYAPGTPPRGGLGYIARAGGGFRIVA